MGCGAESTFFSCTTIGLYFLTYVNEREREREREKERERERERELKLKNFNTQFGPFGPI